jgi:hypothetical protein
MLEGNDPWWTKKLVMDVFSSFLLHIVEGSYPKNERSSDSPLYQSRLKKPLWMSPLIQRVRGQSINLHVTHLHEECPQYHGHKGDPGVTPGTCGAIGERFQVILMWVSAPDV